MFRLVQCGRPCSVYLSNSHSFYGCTSKCCHGSSKDVLNPKVNYYGKNSGRSTTATLPSKEAFPIEPYINIGKLLDPQMKASIEENVKQRKGIGDISEVVRLYGVTREARREYMMSNMDTKEYQDLQERKATSLISNDSSLDSITGEIQALRKEVERFKQVLDSLTVRTEAAQNKPIAEKYAGENMVQGRALLREVEKLKKELSNLTVRTNNTLVAERLSRKLKNGSVAELSSIELNGILR